MFSCVAYAICIVLWSFSAGLNCAMVIFNKYLPGFDRKPRILMMTGDLIVTILFLITLCIEITG